MGKIKLIILLITLSISIHGLSKSLGNFKCYQQITDKEILLETTNGLKVLISAKDNYVIGFEIYSKEETISLIKPAEILSNTDLNGSIYVEELNNLLQITSAVSDGIRISIEKKPFRLTFIDKQNNQILAEAKQSASFEKLGSNLCFNVDDEEEFTFLSKTDKSIASKNLSIGQHLNINTDNQNNTICLISSKGYAIAIDKMNDKHLTYNKNHEILVNSFDPTNKCIQYTFFFGNYGLDLIQRYAFNLTNDSYQMTMK